MEESNIVISNELSYKKKNLAHPKYKFNRIQPTIGQTNILLTSSGGDERVFNIPVKTHNWYHSVLEFQVVPGGGAGANNRIVAYKNYLSPLRQIQLRTSGGQYIVDLNMVNRYMDVVYAAETKLENYLCDEYVSADTNNYTCGFTKSNNLRDATAAGINASRITTDAAGANATETDSTTNYTERLYYQPSSADNAVDPLLFLRIPLKTIYNTFFAVNKDIYFGEVIELRIVFNSKDDIYYSSVGAGAGRIDLAPAACPNVQVKNINLYLAIEQDLNLASQCIEMFNSGSVVLPIPYVYSTKTQQQQSTQQSVSLRYNSGHGRKIRRIYHTLSHPTESLAYNYCRDNIGGTKTVTDYYTTLNNDRLQDFNINTGEQDDYMHMIKKLHGSTVQSIDEYQYKWFHVDDFTCEKELWSNEAQDVNLSSGVPLDVEQKWEFYATTSNRALNHYTFVVVERELHLVPNQILVR